MPNNNEKDEILFEQLKQAKQRKRRRIVITVTSIVLVVLIAIGIAVSTLRANVRERFGSNTADVKTYAANIGRISTVVSGTGTLDSVGSEQIAVPDGVEITEVLIAAGDTLKAGEALATVDTTSVMTALAAAQENLDSLDKQINSAKNDSVSAYMSAGVPGRVKKLFAQNGDNVVDCMTEHGSLAILSVDGLMTVTVEAALEVQSDVIVTEAEGNSYAGKVESSAGGRSIITLTDDGPVYGASVTVYQNDAPVGEGTLAVHNPLAITGYAGTVRSVSVKENQKVYKGSTLFSLTNTGYTANYDALLQTRAQTEETMADLIALLRTGTVEAPFDGTVLSVDYSEDEGSSSTSPASSSAAALMSAYTGSASSAASSASKNAVATMAPDEQVCVNVGIDETDILSLALGQQAEVTITSVSDDPFHGEVTEIAKVGTSYSGVTQYSAVVTLNKEPKMLTGMTATVDIQIEGVDDVVLIPVDALHQTRNISYVYTSYNEETKEYGDMVEVVSGASNSSFVEIVSGLKPGDTVYYTERNTFNFFNMMGGNMGGMNRNSRNSSRTAPAGMPSRNGG